MSEGDRPRQGDLGSWYPVVPGLDWLLDPQRYNEIRWAAFLALVGLAISMPLAVLWFTPIAVLLWAAARITLRSQTLGYLLDAEGLHEVKFGADDICHPWSSLRSVEETKDELQIKTDQGTVVVSREVTASFHLAEHLRRGLGEAPPPESSVTPEQIEAWLGIDEDGVLQTVDSTQGSILGCGTLLLVAASATILHLGRGVAWLALGVAAGVWAVLPTLQPLVEVNAWGLRRGRRWTASWEDVIGSTLVEGDCRVRTTRGEVLIQGEHAHLVHDTVHKLLAAKREGAVLPRMGGVPETALSRASAEEPAERGISRAE